MRIWLLTIGEPLPDDGLNVRLYRTGLLYNELCQSGDDVVWWSSNFNHTKKCFRDNYDNRNSSIVLLKALNYKKNLSLKRVFSHMHLAKEFKKNSKKYPLPDVIISSFPTIELCREAVKFAKSNNIPIIIDVRDLWPDIFLNYAPKALKPFFKLLLFKMFLDAAFVFKNATCISGVSKSYLDWGLNKAKRSISSKDFVMPMGYPKTDLTNKEIIEIERFFSNLGYDKEKFTVLFIGTFGETYDLLTVIKSIKTNPSNFNKIQFVFCGNGPKYGEWLNEAKSIESIIFTDWIDGKKIKYLLLKAVIGLAAYKKGAPQGLPNKIFEYMSTGLPILSSLQGEAEEFLDDNKIGLTYEADNSVSFIKKINLLMHKETRKKMSYNSSKLFNEKYSSHIVYAKYNKKIKQIVKDINEEKTN